ncbi:MAG TPA: hypothetical protein VFO91_09410 [Anaerolineales bacterium]|nr:hypothetical protein [Anaerolineales bacterium]
MNPKSQNLFRWIIVSLLLLTSMSAGQSITVQAKPKVDRQEFHDAMRKLWEDHITWTRLVIIGIFADLPPQDVDASTERLLQNQVDIGNAIKPFYGEEAGEQLTALLRDHILIAAEILQAAEDGNDAVLSDAIARWYANADDIAEFLNAANPKNWPLEEMRSMLRAHLDLTLEEAVTYLNGNYEASVAAYDQVHLQALEMADMLSDGIIKQFPHKFN